MPQTSLIITAEATPAYETDEAYKARIRRELGEAYREAMAKWKRENS